MSRRAWQVFVAPGSNDAPLPVEPSPWHDGRWVKVPREQWELILAFAESIESGAAERLQALSWSRDPNSVVYATATELKLAAGLVERLAREVQNADPLVAAASEEVPDEYENEEHARMLGAVSTVFRESLRMGAPFRAWVE